MKKLQKVFLLLFCFCEAFSLAQTNPAPQALPYSQNFSALTWASTTYPAGWQGWEIGTASSTSFRLTAPNFDRVLVASANASNTFNAYGIYNYNGKVGYLASGTGDPALCLAINTTGNYGITVAYDAMTIRNPYDGGTNTRINEMTLQYRVGVTGNFINVSLPYQNTTTTQTTAVTTPQNSQALSTILPSDCDNQAVVQLRWVYREISGNGARPSFAIDNVVVNFCGSNAYYSYYYRSISSGNWFGSTTWEASPSGLAGTWISVCMGPTSASPMITIQTGHTVSINGPSTANNITIQNGATLQSNNTIYTTLTIIGDIINNGVFQMVNGSFGTEVNFTNNGNQTISGTGGTTNFYSIWMNMGASQANTLEVTSSNFSWVSPLFNSNPKSTVNNKLVAGTFKLSGNALCSGTLLKELANNYSIPANTGIWINNPSASITGSGQNSSINLSGTLRISAGQFDVGSVVDNSIRLLNNSSMIVDGGILNIAGRIQTYNSTPTIQTGATYNQSGGLVTLSSVGANVSTMPDFTIDAGNNFIMSGGTIVIRNEAISASDVYVLGASFVTGGVIQFADANTTNATATGFLIESSSTLPSIFIYKPIAFNPKVYLAKVLTVKGNITISSGTSFTNYYDPTFQYNINLTGNWINDGTFTHTGTGKFVTFNGSAAQTISGTSTTTFKNLSISNSLGGVTLQSPVFVTDALYLNNGLLFSTNTNILTMNAGSTVGSVSNTSFVSGPMNKLGNTNFTFPIGKDAQYRPISVTSLTGSETFTAEYFHADADPTYDKTSKDASIDHVSTCEYWILNRAGAVDANVTLSWDTYSCQIDDLPTLTVARWNGTMWKDQGNGGTTGSTSLGTVASNGLVTSFSPFTLASTTTLNPLPIELLDFTAVYNSSSKTVDVKWKTASERNNNYFTVEKSKDAENFSEVARLNGAGNSTTVLNYSTIDKHPYEGISYYRLKQTDFDGMYKYSNIAAVNISNNSFELVNAVNNDGYLQITLESNSGCNVLLELYDATGKKVLTTEKIALLGKHKLELPSSNLINGIYFLKVSSGNTIISKKCIVNNP